MSRIGNRERILTGLGRTLGVAFLSPPLLCCTWEPGNGFATLETLRLRTALEVSDARDADGALLTDLGYTVRLSELSLVLHQVELSSLEEAHVDDADATEHESAIAILPVERSVNVLQGKTLTLRRVEPSRELPAGLINNVTLRTEGVTVRGTVTRAAVERAAVGESPAMEAVPLNIVLNVDSVLSADVVLDISRDSPLALKAKLGATLHDTLFDGIDFGALVEGGALSLSDPDSPAASQLLAALKSAELSFSPQTEEAVGASHSSAEDHVH